MATLGSKSVDSIVRLKESGSLVEFYVATHNYESGLNGNGRTLLVRREPHSVQMWNSYGTITYYSGSLIDEWFNGTYKNLLDPDIQAAMGTTKFTGSVSSGGSTTRLTTLSRAVFSLSGTELGQAQSYMRVEGTALPNANTLKIAYRNGSAVAQWTRSGIAGGANAWYVNKNGIPTGTSGNRPDAYARPAFTLPATLTVNDDGVVTANTAPTTPTGITVPAKVNGGSTVTIEWTASSDAENNLEGYIVERSIDGGSAWTQIYQGSARSATNSVAFGLDTVMYRVRAYDSDGLYSGWRTSAQITVINNTAPTVPDGITVPEQVNGGQPLTITWGGAEDGENNLAGYSLERQVDGGDWEEIYSGPEQTFTDQITKGWLTVDYRVRAYDTENAYSGYAVAGEAREVNNNTPPEIICDTPSGTSLGEQNAPFAVSYSVRDEEGDPITVTEAIDGVTVRTFKAEPEADYTFDVSGLTYLKALNGAHTLTITAGDGHSETVHRLTFSKLVTAAAVTLEHPMEADGPISVCVLSVTGSIPMDAAYKVEVTNNALDDDPMWQDCTAAVRAGGNVIFENKTVETTPAFNFRVSLERGESGVGGYITSVQGGFQ